MKIETFDKMDRESSITRVATRFIMNALLVGRNRDRIVKLPGSAGFAAGTGVDVGGDIVLGPFIMYKNDKHGYAADIQVPMLVYNNRLYYYNLTSGKWVQQEWLGVLSQDIDFPAYYWSRKTLLLSGGKEGVASVVVPIEKLIVDDDGYFDNALEFDGIWYGEQALPGFDAALYLTGTYGLTSYYYLFDSPPAWVQTFEGGVSTTEGNFLAAQFITTGGQPAIPSNASVIALDNNRWNNTGFGAVRIALPADIDKRITAIDLYVTQNEGLTSYLQFPEVEAGGGLDRAVTEVEFAGLPWRYLRRIDINQPTVVFISTMKAISQVGLGTWLGLDSGPLDSISDLDFSYFPDDAFTSGDYVAIVKPITGGTEVIYDILLNYFEEGLYGDNKRILIDDPGHTLNEDDFYVVSIASKWTHRASGVSARGAIQLLDNPAPIDIRTVVVGTTPFVAGSAAWPIGGTTYLTLENLKDAINASAELVTATLGLAVVFIEANTPGTAGNSIVLAVNGDNDEAMATAETLVGGLDGEHYTIDALWRFPNSSSIETYDPWTESQAWALSKETFRPWLFSALQNRRQFYIDAEDESNIFYSEVDRYSLTPLENTVSMNTNGAEAARGLFSARNAIVALYERTSHVLRMTGEPVVYDAEEDKIDIGAISRRCAVTNGTMVLWLDEAGINGFDGQFVEFSDQFLQQDIIALVENEHSVAGSYEGIRAGYCPKRRIFIWAFPNSTYEIEGYAIKFLGYDHSRQQFFFVESNRAFTDFAVGYGGELYGAADGGVYELFSTSPDELNRMIYRSGKFSLTKSRGNVTMGESRLTYTGEPTMKTIVDTSASPASTDFYAASASIKTEGRQGASTGELIQIEIATALSAGAASIEEILLDLSETG